MVEKKMHGFRARLDYVLKHNQTINKLFRKSASMCMKSWGYFIPMDNKMVLFSAHSRKYNDSPRAIYEYMIKQKRFKDYIFVWALEDPENVEIPGSPLKIKSDTLEYFKFSLKAKYWITCVNIERSLRYKKKNCIYLNTWHGLSINHCGNAVPGRQDCDFSNIDFVCYESEYHRKILIRDFLCRDDAMIPTGLPRNDKLYQTNEHQIIDLKKKLGLPLDKKILLYTPTWRDSTDMGKTYSIKPPINIDIWRKELQGEYILLMRTHAYTTKLLGIEFNNFVRDMTNYPDINDLFKVADVLISDYSSCIADYSILERPIICFAYDYDDYCKTRGLYIDLRKEMPSGIKRNENEVIDHIKNMNYRNECNKTREFKEKYTNIGGHATELCVEYMFGKGR